MVNKSCKICGHSKSISEFFKNGFHGRRPECKTCSKDKEADWPSRIKLKQKTLESSRWGSSFEEQETAYREYEKSFLLSQTIKRNTNRRRCSKRREFFKANPGHPSAIKQKLRVRLNIAVKTGVKSGSSVADLGCSIPEFKLYIAGKFKPGMTWENWGIETWHLDHIKPLALFDLSDREQFKKAVHFSNYQPLWAQENRSKGDRFLSAGSL